MKKILKIIGIILILLFISSFVMFKYFPQVTTYVFYHTFLKKSINKSADLTPVQVVIPYSVSPKTGSTYSNDRLSLVTDWEEKKNLDGNTIIFNDDKIIILNSSVSQIQMYDELIKSAKEKNKSENMELALHKMDLNSDRDIYEYMLNLTSDDINLSNSADKSVINLILLPLKGVMLLDSTKILSYSYNNLDFYQYNPNPERVAYEIIIFDQKNNKYGFTIAGTNLTQEEIYSIVKTVNLF